MKKADFALQWLDYLGNKIYNNGERIFKYYEPTGGYQPIYKISKLNSYIKVGKELGEEDDDAEYSRMSFSEFEKLGFIVVIGTDYVWRQGQKCHYKIRRKSRNSMGISQTTFNKGLQIQYDPSNRRIRLLGENSLADHSLPRHSGIGPWIVYDEDKPIITRHIKKDVGLTKEQSRSSLKEWLHGEHSPEAEYQNINEIPILLSDEKYIVCIKKALTCQRMIVVGESGMGKSVDGETLIPYQKDGQFKVDKIKDIKLDGNLRVISLHGLTKVKGYMVHEDDRKRIKITTRTGKSITGTPDHSFIVMNKKGEIVAKKGDEIKLNDCFVTLNHIGVRDDITYSEFYKMRDVKVIKLKNRRGINKTFKVDDDFAFFLGIYQAEGCIYNRGVISISNQNKAIKERIKKFCIKNNLNPRESNNGIEFESSALQCWVDRECYHSKKTRKGKGSGAERKKIPNIVYNKESQFVYNFLSGLFSGDGYIQHIKPRTKNRTKESFFIGIDLCSERLIDDLIFLLSAFKILSSKRSSGRRNRLAITGRYINKFLNNVKLYDKNQEIFRICENDSFDVVPYTTLFIELLKDNKLSKKWANLDIKESDNKYGYMGRRRAERLVEKFKAINPNNKNLLKIEELLNKSWFYDRITKIEKIDSPGLVYDLETEDNSFLANNIFVHNSLFVNSVSGRIFYMWQDRVGWLIDPLNQFEDLSLPQDYEVFNEINSLIGNEPKPIPAVQLYLSCKNKINMLHKNISLLLTLDFAEFLKKYQFFVYGMKDLDVGNTIRYINDYKKDIMDITTAKEMQEIMFEKIPNAHKDAGKTAMIYKWVNTFDTIFKEKFTSNLYQNNDNATSQLEVKFQNGDTMKGHPFIMCYEAGLVPVLNISAARRERWLRNYLASLMQKIVAHQSGLPDEKRHRVWIVADELNEIYEHGKKKDNAYSAFAELYRQGRFSNIGFIGNTQSLTK